MIVDPSSLERQALHDFLVAATTPRFIAWVSTVSETGVHNLAPFSACMVVCLRPAIIGFSLGWKKRNGTKKDTLRNIENNGEFVINMVTENLLSQMNLSSATFPAEISEFTKAGLTPAKAHSVKPPLVAQSPVNIECRLRQIQVFGDSTSRTSFIMGDIVVVDVKDEFLTEGAIDVARLSAVGRAGEGGFCVVRNVIHIQRPK